MNEQIIRLLSLRPDQYVSGEALSRELHCSRTAVWKHIQALREMGYEFDAVSRKGYRLIGKPSRIESGQILLGLRTKRMGRKVYCYNQVASTQTVANQLVQEGAEEGTLVIAEQQTAGKGRQGKVWHSPMGKGIWMSLVLKPPISLPYTPQLTLLAAVALCRAIKERVSVEVGIKWPNDLLIDGKKICGILLESNAEDERLRYVIAGIGVSANLALNDFPPELRDKATSLSIAGGKPIDRIGLIQDILEQFERLYDAYLQEGFAPIRILWEALTISLDRPIRVRTKKGLVEGVAQSLNRMGALVVKLSDGETIQIYSGNVE